jgi:hypothetical protein
MLQRKSLSRRPPNWVCFCDIITGTVSSRLLASLLRWLAPYFVPKQKYLGLASVAFIDQDNPPTGELQIAFVISVLIFEAAKLSI